MTKKRIGCLVYNSAEDRYQIRFGSDDYSSTFHCGEVLEIKIMNRWKSVRMEYNSKGWYLVGHGSDITGLMARL